ncbi:MAG: hypothetical protein VX768_00705 [Planctomycetota bacterium]|nr:hypothetical protein [Planctomycetota bacterium]
MLHIQLSGFRGIDVAPSIVAAGFPVFYFMWSFSSTRLRGAFPGPAPGMQKRLIASDKKVSRFAHARIVLF